MRRGTWLWCAAVFLPAGLSAGQIYGSLTFGGRPVPRAGFTVNCGGAVSAGAAADDGSYRIYVPQQGRCRFELAGYQGRPAADVFSYPNPTQYDFELVRRPDGGYELRRR
jgi:hypothetical protein